MWAPRRDCDATERGREPGDGVQGRDQGRGPGGGCQPHERGEHQSGNQEARSGAGSPEDAGGPGPRGADRPGPMRRLGALQGAVSLQGARPGPPHRAPCQHPVGGNPPLRGRIRPGCRMQGEVQKWVDHSISVTVNLPKDVNEELVSQVYTTAWESGCKGMTIYRDGSRDGVLISNEESKEADTTVFKETKAPPRPKKLDAEISPFR